MTKKMKETTQRIPLTRGEYAIVDSEYFEWLNQWKWNLDERGKYFYAVRWLPKKDGKQKKVSMHRFITSAPDGMEVDHINGDCLDNRKANLRVCSHAENQRNSRVRKDNTSGYKGVCFNKKSKRWKAQIRIGGGERLHLGYFPTAEEASFAYNEAAKKHHGDFTKVTN